MDALKFCQLLIGPLMLIISLIFWKYPPKKPNNFYGYRTKRSMKSQEVWEDSNSYSTLLLIKVSIFTLVVQIITYLLIPTEQSIVISTIVLVVGILAILPLTEKRLKEKFDEEGNRKG